MALYGSMRRAGRRKGGGQVAVETRAAIADHADMRIDVQAGGQPITMIAIYDGQQWASLSPELDIASVGKDSEEALSNLETAIREAVAFAEEAGLKPGHPVPNEDLLDFLRSHQGPEGVVGSAILI